MIKKILSVGIIATLLALVMSVTAFAAETTVAKIGDKEYTTLQTAVNEANAGDVITVLDDITVTSHISVSAGKDVVLDLNGKVIQGIFVEAEASKVFEVDGKLTVKDTSDAKKGKITSYAENPDTGKIPGYGSNTILVGGSFVLESGTIENLTASGSSCYAIDVKWVGSGTSNITINGGKAVAVKTAVRAVAWQSSIPVNLTVNGGEIEGSRAIMVQLPGNDGSAKDVNVTINGGTITATGENSGSYAFKFAIYSYSSGDYSFSGVDIAVNNGSINGDIAVGGGSTKDGNSVEKVRINGGSFSGLYGDVYTYTEDDDIEISGGTFSSDVSCYVLPGYEAVFNATTGTYGIDAATTVEGTKWYSNTDAGYYVTADTTYGMIRFLFAADIEGEVTKFGIKYIKGSDITADIAKESSVSSEQTGDAKAFYGDIAGIAEGADDTYFAIAYVEVAGKTYWSEVVSCTPNWSNDYTGYAA